MYKKQLSLTAGSHCMVSKAHIEHSSLSDNSYAHTEIQYRLPSECYIGSSMPAHNPPTRCQSPIGSNPGHGTTLALRTWQPRQPPRHRQARPGVRPLVKVPKTRLVLPIRQVSLRHLALDNLGTNTLNAPNRRTCNSLRPPSRIAGSQAPVRHAVAAN